MAVVNTLEIYEILKREFTDAQAKAITKAIEKAFEQYEEHEKELRKGGSNEKN